jgi:hypothetical protein
MTGTDSPRSDVAVVLCTYNGAAHVAQQVRSILEQRVLPGELRVYDDGSADDTIAVVERTWRDRSERATGVGLHVAPPAARSFGAAQNFARAIMDSPQPVLALADQDDEWLPDRLSATLAVLDASPEVEVVASDATMVDALGRPVGRTVFEAQRLTRAERAAFTRHDHLPALVRRNLVPGMTFTLRRSLMEALGPLPDGAMHDYWLAAAAAARGTFRIVPRPLVRYRIHGGNAVGLDTGRRGLVDRVRIKARAFRAPLTDLPQWTTLPDRLAAAGDPAAAERLREKRAFEIARRHPQSAALDRIGAAAALLRGDGYLRFEFQGRATGIRDLVRRRDPYLAGVGQYRDQ